MNIWVVSREYAGIAESGGVKNVVCSLSEQFAFLGHSVTVFIPYYGCTDIKCLENYRKDFALSKPFTVAGKERTVSFSEGFTNGVKIVLVSDPIFEEKKNVYTYCKKDLKKFPDASIGTGYEDNLVINTLFARAVLSYGTDIKDTKAPDIVHCHDACTALVPSLADCFAKKYFSKSKFIVTIHNAGPAYHHEFCDKAQAKFITELKDKYISGAENGKRIEPYLMAAKYALLTTVSVDYANEILDPENPDTDGLSQILSAKKIQVTGITNGIDINRYLPEDTSVSLLPYEFSPVKGELDGKYALRKYFAERYASGTPCTIKGIKGFGTLQPGKIWFSFHGRLVRQKGILVLLDAVRKILSYRDDLRFVIHGQGEVLLEKMCAKLAKDFPGKVLYLRGYDKALSRQCIASCDFAVLPSQFEPCGLEDFIAQIYGTIPVAHATGGLKKIIHGKTGFLYEPNTSEALEKAIISVADKKEKKPECFDKMIVKAAKYVKSEYSWETVAKEKYLKFYESALDTNE